MTTKPSRPLRPLRLCGSRSGTLTSVKGGAMTERLTSVGGGVSGARAEVHESRHPLVRVKLTALRNKQTEPLAFRLRVRELTWLLAYEALADLPVEEVVVETPLAVTAGYRLAP